MPAKTIYPWDRWFARKTKLTLHRGKDFECQPHGMAQQFRKQAAKRDVTIEIHIDDEKMVVSLA
jgi:hypothetical protein|tara:strand:- start:3935 stop:4126 length:192 start_codon:yes stop_codon:yes gene_type:complete